MANSYTRVVYLGSDDDGRRLSELLNKYLERRDISFSAFIRELIEKELAKHK